MGPLRSIDLIGVDTTMFVANVLYEEFKEPLFAPPPLLKRMVTAVISAARPAGASTSTGRPVHPSARSGGVVRTTTTNSANAMTWATVHHRQIAPMRMSSA